MTSNSAATLTAKIAEKTRQIEEMAAMNQETLSRALKGLDDALTQSISVLQLKLITDLKQQLQAAHATTMLIIQDATTEQNQMITQMAQIRQQQTQNLKRNLTIMGLYSLIIMGFGIVLLLILLAIVWVRTPTSLMGEPSQVMNGWVVLTDPHWTTCQFRQGNLSPCRLLPK